MSMESDAKSIKQENFQWYQWSVVGQTENLTGILFALQQSHNNLCSEIITKSH